MKRSEFSLELSKVIWNHIKSMSEPTQAEAESLAEYLTYYIESVGMLPPTVRFLATDEYSNIKDLDVLHDYDMDFSWEPEEE